MCFGYVNLNFEDLFYENLEMTKDKMMVKEGENMKNKYSECNVDEALEYITINKDKYCERFRALENGKRKFNFCAALFGGFGGVWQAFHFMFLEWGILILIEIMVDVGLNLIQACNFANPFKYKTVEIVNILYFVALFLFWGFFGDTLLLKSIKRKIVLGNKGGGKTNRIKIVYKHQKVMLFRVVSAVVIYGLGIIILWEVPRRMFFAILY